MKSAIIIGSGITGMAAALLLAKQKIYDDITILEAAKSPAPLLSGFRRKGLHFDTGFHCAGGLRENGILRYWLQTLGVWEHIGQENIYTLSEEFRFANNTQKYHFPAMLADLLPSIKTQFGASSAQTFAKLLKQMQDVINISPYTNPRCNDLPRLSFENSQSLLQTIEPLNLSAELKQMLKARCLLYGLAPQDASFHDYSLVGGLYFDSCHGIYGGGLALVNALLKCIKKQGIKLRCNAQVSRIIHKDKKFHAVEFSDGELLFAEQCIYTGHPKALPYMVDKGVFRPAFLQHIASIEETASAFMLFGESKNDYLINKAVYLLPSDTNASVLSPLESAEPTAYVVGGQSASESFSLVAIIPMQNNDFMQIDIPRPEQYLHWKKTQAKKMQAYIENRLPELGAIEIHDTATSASMRQWVFGSSGSLYGMAHTVSSIPLLPVTRMQGLFLAGQNILLPGILGGIISAALAVGFATEHGNVLEGFRQCAGKE